MPAGGPLLVHRAVYIDHFSFLVPREMLWFLSVFCSVACRSAAAAAADCLCPFVHIMLLMMMDDCHDCCGCSSLCSPGQARNVLVSTIEAGGCSSQAPQAVAKVSSITTRMGQVESHLL
jgi:hypothetical protein